MQRQIDRVANPSNQAQVIDVLAVSDETVSSTDQVTITPAAPANLWG